MLFLLRNIRRKLMSENKVITYMLYAVGEIILVVVGILIAVQIDNYRQDLQDEKLARQYLIRIRNEFRQNIETQKKYDNSLVSVLGDFKKISDYLHNPSASVNADSLFNECSPGIFAFFVNDNLTTYDELKQSGNMELLKDTTIIQKLMEFEVERQRFDKITGISLEYQKPYATTMEKNKHNRIIENDGVLTMDIQFKSSDYLNDDNFKNAFFSVAEFLIGIRKEFDRYHSKTVDIEKLLTDKINNPN